MKNQFKLSISFTVLFSIFYVSSTMAADGWSKISIRTGSGKIFNLYQTPGKSYVWSDKLKDELNQDLDVQPINGAIQKSAATEACKKLGEMIGRPMRLPSVQDYEDHLMSLFSYETVESLRIQGKTKGYKVTVAGVEEMLKIFPDMKASDGYWTTTLVPSDSNDAFSYLGYGVIHYGFYRNVSNGVRCIGGN